MAGYAYLDDLLLRGARPVIFQLREYSELSGTPEAAAQLEQDVPGLELGVDTLARCAQLNVSAIGGLLGGGLVPAPAGGITGSPTPV